MIDLTKFGNFKGYTPENRVVKSHDSFCEQDVAALKVYSMLCEKTRQFTDQEINFTKYFVGRALESKRIDPKIGLGFLILSEDVLNVNIWGGDYPCLINPNIYEFPENGILTQTFVRKDVKDVGAYCAWEGAIVGHESRVWRQYMHSKRTKQDKALWLMDVYSGNIQTVPGSLAGKNISKLDIQTRTCNVLLNANIKTIVDLMKKTERQLKDKRNIG